MFSKILLAVNSVARETIEDQIVKSYIIQALSQGLLRLRNRHFWLLDTIVFAIAPILALAIRLDDSFILAPYLGGLIQVTILFVLIKLTVLYAFGFYKRCWRYASIDELEQIVMLMAAIAIVQTSCFNFLYYLDGFWVNSLPRALPLLDTIISFLFVGGIRFSIPVLNRLKQRHLKFYRRDRVLIVGAGCAGISLVREMQQSPWLGFYPVAFIDDDPAKLNLQIRRLPVVGDRYKIPEVVRSLHIRRVIIAMPAVPGRVIREILDICRSSGVPTSTLPGLNEILTNRIRVGSVRDIQIEDLLRRESIQSDIGKVGEFLQGKKVLISGAGGSIGSELCRQVLKCRPAEMMLLGHGENSLFAIQQELERILPALKQEGEPSDPIPQIKTFIADIRFFNRLEYLFEQFRPQIIFHAAAHKHVPLMESHPPEAIANNVRGTKNLVDLALKYGVEHFITISTDKAVNPTSIMGASKRVAEMLVLQAAQKSGKPFVVVRFGNVLGSRGSVVPTFKQQIAQGGPITITHPDIRRYFMTIPEAVQLLLQAAVIGRGGEVFMLDMGEPVKIVDLAKDMIRLSGYEVDKDIEIVFTGLRPGEKLFEELFIPGEEYERTQHEKIIKVKNASRIVPAQLDLEIEALCEAATKNHSTLIVFLLEQLVPEYTPDYLNLEGQASAVDSNSNPEEYRLNNQNNPPLNQLFVPY
jgi:FlaA1/EpsC-like NDP-sugar epimerase